MCVAVPMKIESLELGGARCVRTADDPAVFVSTALVADPENLAPGVWVLVFQNEALRIVTEEESLAVRRALEATANIMAGNVDESNVAAGFGDLIDREPPLPPHLQAQLEREREKRRLAEAEDPGAGA